MAGRYVTLTCYIFPRTGVSDTADSQWEGSGVNDSTISDERAFSQLIFNGIATSHAGVYNCSATYGLIHFFTNTTITVESKYKIVCIHLSEYSLPTSPSTYNIAHHTLIAGTEGNLTCDYTLSQLVDTPVVENTGWAVNGSSLATSGDGRISVDGASIIFSPLSASDSGRYTCTLKLSAPQSPHVVQAPGQRSEEVLITVRSKVLQCLVPSSYHLQFQVYHCDLPFSFLSRSTCSKCPCFTLWVLHCWPEVFPALLDQCCAWSGRTA